MREPVRCLGALVVILAGCAGEEHIERTAESESVADTADTAAVVVAFLVDTVPFEEGDFPHRPHAAVACAECHTEMRGHETHTSTACADCHTPPEPAATAAPAECAGCHHAPDVGLTCSHCHTDPVSARSVPSAFAIADRPAETRRLSFDHGVHARVECRSCHSGGSALAAVPCTTCHADHHRPAADCAACHAPFPLATHDVSAHLACTGAGCHTASSAWEPPRSRAVCLSCHREQVDHEPGGDCRSCHVLTGAGS